MSVEEAPTQVAAGFEGFYRREYAAVTRVLAGMTGRWGVAEELAQEALVAAYRNWDRLQTLDRPELWVRRVAVHRAISAHRRVVAEVAALGRLGRRPRPETQEPPLPQDERLWAAVRGLPRTQAVAIVLWAVEDRRFEEIGVVLGCSAETARTHLRRARRRLGNLLREELDDDR